MTRTRWLGAAVAVAVVVAGGSSGCAVIPLTGPHSVADAGGGDPLSKPFQRMIAIRPQPDWGPTDIIKGLQAAMAAYPDDPTILPGYLTPRALAKWDPSGPVTVIEDGFEVLPPDPRDGSDAVLKVSLKARWAAKIREDDSYVPMIGSWEGGTFELVKDAQGGYRVNDLPSGLLLTAADVARAYRATNLYYLSRGHAQDPRLVADRVWLRLKPTESFAQTILERLLKPPTSALQGGAVTTSFPAGTEVDSIRYGEDRVLVNLSGPLDPAQDGSLLAQIRYSLNRNEVAKGRTIEVQVDGEMYGLDQPNSDERWLDDGSGTAYYASGGAVHYLGKDGPAGAVPGPAGEPRDGYSDFAMSRDGDLIAAKTSTGISVAGLTPEGQWQEVIQGADLTAPTWHRDGSLWTYDRQNGNLLRYDPANRGAAEPVESPLKGLDVTRLRIARDGVRVAVTTGENTVQIGAFVEHAGKIEPGNFQMLTTTEAGEKILDLAWGDADHVLVLVDSNAGQILNQIGVGDGETVGVPLKDPLESLAAQGDRVLAAARTKTGAKVVELNQDQKTWTTKVESDGIPLFPLG
ncbi:LpqB family beta-propeller domain-containing protein [Nonomuraea sp. B12E4]|uniref:LpqB family beta-propeller domain-containing protein n=1 Tax=Nonomuraea sp. B12E4 TaxID=3153564 RepID=UPI00325E8237